jgi:hypothetical protein
MSVANSDTALQASYDARSTIRSLGSPRFNGLLAARQSLQSGHIPDNHDIAFD